MNVESFVAVGKLVGSTYAQQAAQARRRKEQHIQLLLHQVCVEWGHRRHVFVDNWHDNKRKWPENGWEEATIEMLLQELASMDSNNFQGNVGVGEREARFACDMVARRHYRMGHGVGRSGDIAAIQPKAAGSSVLAKVTTGMTLDVLRLCGLTRVKACLVVPVATGMAIVLTLLALRAARPAARVVVWPRVDQKSCLKAIFAAGFSAGFEPLVVPNILDGDEVVTNMVEVTRLLHSLDPQTVACVVTTTSCFAPRAPDSIVEIALLCQQFGIPHVVNNAYGLQHSKYAHLINEGMRVGRVDAVVQSTDKNLLVPVGGAIVCGSDAVFIDAIGKAYPGRASVAPAMDVFITLLSLGQSGFRALLAERKRLFEYCQEKLGALAVKHNERLLVTPNNGISMGMSLASAAGGAGGDGVITMLGSMLFSRCVSGTRVVDPTERKSVGPLQFEGYGAHMDAYPVPYLTAAVALGMVQSEIDTFLERLDKVLFEFNTKRAKARDLDTVTALP